MTREGTFQVKHMDPEWAEQVAEVCRRWGEILTAHWNRYQWALRPIWRWALARELGTYPPEWTFPC